MEKSKLIFFSFLFIGIVSLALIMTILPSDPEHLDSKKINENRIIVNFTTPFNSYVDANTVPEKALLMNIKEEMLREEGSEKIMFTQIVPRAELFPITNSSFHVYVRNSEDQDIINWNRHKGGLLFETTLLGIKTICDNEKNESNSIRTIHIAKEKQIFVRDNDSKNIQIEYGPYLIKPTVNNTYEIIFSTPYSKVHTNVSEGIKILSESKTACQQLQEDNDYFLYRLSLKRQ